jgi:hypothetical protein
MKKPGKAIPGFSTNRYLPKSRGLGSVGVKFSVLGKML